MDKFNSEEKCKKFLTKKKWPNGPECNTCMSIEHVYYLRNQDRYKCRKCKKQFSLLSGTIFHSTKLPLTVWFQLIYLMTTSKSGESSHKLSRLLGIQQPTIWRMAHKVRTQMKNTDKSLLSGIVEVDEVFISPKPIKDLRVMARKMRHNKEEKERHGDKDYIRYNPRMAIFGAVQRGGDIRLEILGKGPGCRTKKLIEFYLKKLISKDAVVVSDEHRSYNGVSKIFKEHWHVKHSKRKYVNGEIHTNNIENAWYHLQKTIRGIHIHTSYRHLEKYLHEFEYRWNGRKKTELLLFNEFFEFAAF